jgi:hypothetical protein
MTTRRYPAVTITAAILVIAGAGCADPNDKRTEPAGSVDERATATPSSTRPLELTSDTLDAYERGLKKEIEAVRAAQQRSGTATTAQERGEAIQASFEDATIPPGAAAAGLSVEQYRGLRETVNGIFRTLDFQGRIDGPLSIDLSRADAATKERRHASGSVTRRWRPWYTVVQTSIATVSARHKPIAPAHWTAAVTWASPWLATTWRSDAAKSLA